MAEEIRNLIAWTHVGPDGVEHVGKAVFTGGDLILLACAEGGDDEAEIDVLARHAARLAGIKVRKRRFRAVADLEVCDGRPTSPSPDPAPRPDPDPEEPDADA